MSKLSLGAMLRQNIANAEAIAEQLREEAKLRQLQEDETAVRKFFYDAQQQTIATILAGDPVEPVQVGNGRFDDVAKLTNSSDNGSDISKGIIDFTLSGRSSNNGRLSKSFLLSG